MSEKNKKNTFSYNAAIEEIETILAQIETENIDIDSLSKKVSRAAELIKLCSKKLRDTEAEIESVLKEDTEI
jgi:exodeoxyribonuclease VII small subunit